jgi:branched-chain amino acid transport system ATP-binding protein
LLEVKNLQAGYDYLQVLWDVSLRVSQGEFVALLGPNGAGKTTILRTIAGVITPMTGEVRLHGESIGGLSAHQIHRKGLSFVPEDLNLFAGMTVHQLAGTLSGGERKMLGVARGLMSGPSLLLVDEPSLGLAPMLVMSVLETLQELNRNGVTILLVEQNVNMTLHLADRSYVLEQGRIALEGTSAALLENEHVQEAYLALGE